MSTSKGRSGEDQATRFLEKLGYRILGRNIRLGRGEIDIIACDDELLLFVEVKSHQNPEASLLAVNEDKCQRLHSAAEAWLACHRQYQQMQCRFDLMIVTPRIGLRRWMPAEIEHLKDIIH